MNKIYIRWDGALQLVSITASTALDIYSAKQFQL